MWITTCAFAVPADRATPHIATKMHSFNLIRSPLKLIHFRIWPEFSLAIPCLGSELFNTHCSGRLNLRRSQARLLSKNKVCIARALLHARYNAHLAGSG